MHSACCRFISRIRKFLSIAHSSSEFLSVKEFLTDSKPEMMRFYLRSMDFYPWCLDSFVMVTQTQCKETMGEKNKKKKIIPLKNFFELQMSLPESSGQRCRVPTGVLTVLISDMTTWKGLVETETWEVSPLLLGDGDLALPGRYVGVILSSVLRSGYCGAQGTIDGAWD